MPFLQGDTMFRPICIAACMLFVLQTRSFSYNCDRPGSNWSDSYSVNGKCYCATTFDHGIGAFEVMTPAGLKTVKEICEAVGPGPGKSGNPVYNDIQCGNGPANFAGDEDPDCCPGRTDQGASGCVVIGPMWDLSVFGSGPQASPVTNNDTVYASRGMPLTTLDYYSGVLRNDYDPNGDLFSAELFQDASHGTVSLNDNGTFTYTPEGDYYGTDEFSYRATDGAPSNVSTVTVNIVNGIIVDWDDYSTRNRTKHKMDVPGYLGTEYNNIRSDGSLKILSNLPASIYQVEFLYLAQGESRTATFKVDGSTVTSSLEMGEGEQDTWQSSVLDDVSVNENADLVMEHSGSGIYPDYMVFTPVDATGNTTLRQTRPRVGSGSGLSKTVSSTGIVLTNRSGRTISLRGQVVQSQLNKLLLRD